MKILIVNTLYHPYSRGGAEKSVRLLAEELVSIGNEVSVLTLSQENNIEKIDVNGVKVIRVPTPNSYWPEKNDASLVRKLLWHIKDIYNFTTIKLLDELFEKENFDVIHTNNLSGFSVSVWKWAKGNNYPVVHTSRDYYLFHPNCTLYKNNEHISLESNTVKFFSFVKKRLSKKVAGYVGISDYIRDLHKKEGFFQNAVTSTIYNSISTSNIKKEIAEKNSAQLDLFRFGFIGRLDKEKGIELLITAFDKRKSNEMLLIAGDGDEKYVDSLKSMTANENIVFLGRVDSDSFFDSIDCTVVPSLWNEPMGRVVIESFSFGVPVIGSCSGGISELIENDKNGIKFITGNIESLSKAMDDIRGKVSLQWKENCILSSLKFESNNVAASYLKVYNQVLKN